MAFTYIMGGKGDTSGRKDANGAGYNPTLRTWDDSQVANGVALCVSTEPSAGQGADDGAGGFYVRITGGSGDFSGALEGVLANVNFTTIYTAGRYEVKGTNDDTWIDIDLVYSSDALTDNAFVGGAYGNDAGSETHLHLQWAFDILEVGDTLKIRDIMTFKFAATVDYDGISGTESSRITIEIVDASGDRIVVGDTATVMEPSVDIAGAMIEIGNSTDFVDWYFLNVSGDDGAGNTADYAIRNTDASCYYHRFFNCVLHDTDSSVMPSEIVNLLMMSCEVYGSKSGHGGSLGGWKVAVIGCSFHNNATRGLHINAPQSFIANNKAYDNGQYGIFIDNSCDDSFIVNNTSVNNGSGGFYVGPTAQNNVFVNNTGSSNTVEGFRLNGNMGRFAIFAHNHAWNNDSGHYSEGDDASWAAAGYGSNVSGDPLFMEVSSTSLESFDHIGPEYTVTDSKGLFYSGMVGKTLRITGTGILGRFVIGAYKIVSYTSATEIALDADPTGGDGNDTIGAYTFLDNFTPKYGSPLLGVGFPALFQGGEYDQYTNYAGIGAVSPELLKATLGRGFNRGIA